jgi:drug/metabolite transporter (DMT)-like permease
MQWRRRLAVLMDAMAVWTGLIAGAVVPANGKMVRRWEALPPNMRGILWIMAAGVALTLMTALIKALGTRIPVVQILFLRQFVLTVMMTPRMVRDPRTAFATEHLKLHALRALFALIAMMTGFTAIVHLPLADAVAISFSKSFFVTIFAILILQEVVSRHRWAAVILGFVGVLIMVRPSPEGFDPYALLGLISAAAVGLVMVIIRKLAQREPLATVITYQAVLVGGALLIPALMYWVEPTPVEWAMLLLIGFLSAIGQSLNFNGFRAGEATAVASADYLRLVYATGLGVLVFNEWPTLPALAGAALIVGTTLYAMWAERRPSAARVAAMKAEASRVRAPAPAE